ncbi:hypothetical protein D3C72_1919940 [compost metagenome]
MTIAPFDMTLPTVSLALTSGVRSGRFASSIGVGTVTIKTAQSRKSSACDVNASCVAAFNSSLVVSSV